MPLPESDGAIPRPPVLTLVCTVYRRRGDIFLRCPAEYFRRGAVYELRAQPLGGGPPVIVKARAWRVGGRIAYLYVYSAYRAAIEGVDRVAVSL